MWTLSFIQFLTQAVHPGKCSALLQHHPGCGLTLLGETILLEETEARQQPAQCFSQRQGGYGSEPQSCSITSQFAKWLSGDRGGGSHSETQICCAAPRLVSQKCNPEVFLDHLMVSETSLMPSQEFLSAETREEWIQLSATETGPKLGLCSCF